MLLESDEYAMLGMTAMTSAIFCFSSLISWSFCKIWPVHKSGGVSVSGTNSESWTGEKEKEIPCAISSCLFASPSAEKRSSFILVSALRLFSRCCVLSCMAESADMRTSVSFSFSLYLRNSWQKEKIVSLDCTCLSSTYSSLLTPPLIHWGSYTMCCECLRVKHDPVEHYQIMSL